MDRHWLLILGMLPMAIGLEKVASRTLRRAVRNRWTHIRDCHDHSCCSRGLLDFSREFIGKHARDAKMTVSRLQPLNENRMEANPSKEQRPAMDLHQAWHVVGWLERCSACWLQAAAVVMARNDSVSVERSKRTTAAESGPRVFW